MAVKHATINVGTTATSLIGAVADGDYRGTRVLVVQNTGAADVFVGGAGVTTANYGYRIAAGGALVLDLNAGDVPYAVVAVAQNVNVLHLGVNA